MNLLNGRAGEVPSLRFMVFLVASYFIEQRNPSCCVKTQAKINYKEPISTKQTIKYQPSKINKLLIVFNLVKDQTANSKP